MLYLYFQDDEPWLTQLVKLSIRNLYKDMFFQTPEAGAQTILHCCLDPQLATKSGRYE